jgi:hypothetical protein
VIVFALLSAFTLVVEVGDDRARFVASLASWSTFSLPGDHSGLGIEASRLPMFLRETLVI